MTATAAPANLDRDAGPTKKWGMLAAVVGSMLLLGSPGLLVLLLFSAADSGSGGGGSAATLNPAGIPAEDVTWIKQAGALCPQISAPLLAAQLEQESGFRADATSPAGAQGIAQFMLATWPAYSQPPAVPGPDVPTNPADAIMAQGRYMCSLAAEAMSSGITTAPVPALALAGYNAGWGAVAGAHGIPGIPETQQYVQLITAMVPRYTAALTGPGPAGVSPGAGDGTSQGTLAAAWPVVLAWLQAQLGKPYVWGGVGPDGYDCSGLVMVAYQQVGINLPRTSQAQYQATLTSEMPYSAAQPGDLLFMEGTPPGHVGVYLGGGQMLQAPHTGANVDIVAVPVSALTGVSVP